MLQLSLFGIRTQDVFMQSLINRGLEDEKE